jgi:hypothetical protein
MEELQARISDQLPPLPPLAGVVGPILLPIELIKNEPQQPKENGKDSNCLIDLGGGLL